MRCMTSSALMYSPQVNEIPPQRKGVTGPSPTSVTRTLENSNLPLTRSNFCFLSDHFCIMLLSITRTMFWALKKSGNKSVLASETLDFEVPLMCCWRVVGWCWLSQILRETALLLKTVKRMFYLGYALLRYVLIYNLKVSFNFHLTFLQYNVIKMFTVQ